MSPREKNLRDALEALYRAHVRETGHQGGECANCFVAHAVLAETAPSPSPRPAQEAVRPVYGGGDDSLCDCPWRHDKGRALHAMGCPAVAGLEPNPMRSPRPGDTKEGK